MTVLGKIEPKRIAVAAMPDADAARSIEDRIDATLDEDVAYDILSEGLRTGRFGGVARDTSASVALVEVLRLRGWPVNYRVFADAIPHYAERFEIEEARAALRRLDLSAEPDMVRGRNLGALPLGSFVITKNDRCLFLRLNADGHPALFDPHSNMYRRVRHRKVYRCMVIEDAAPEVGARASRISWIGRTIGRFGPENRIILLLTFLSNTLIILASLSVGMIFDKVLPAKAYDTLFSMLIGIGMLLYVDLRLRKTKSQIIARVSGRLEYIVSSSLYEKLTSFRLEMLTASSVSEQMNRLKQFEMVRDFYCGPIVAVLFEMPFVLLLLCMVWAIAPPVAMLLLGVIAVYLLIGVTIYPRITSVSKDMSGLRAECLRLQEETISQREQIVQRGLGQVWTARMAPKLRKLSLARHRLDAVWRMLNALIAVVSPLAIGGVIIVGSIQVIGGNMSGGSLIACMIMSTRLLSPVQQALVLAVRAPELSNLFKQLDAMMQIPSGQPDRPANVLAQLNKHAKAPMIAVDGLILRYPRSVAPAIKAVTLNFEAGSFTCLTGPSGAGKSSLLGAIMGHYRAQSGTVLIGPTNIEQFDSREKTDLIGYLGHRSLQIHGTIAQNLRLTRPAASQAQLDEVCDELGILDTINALPDGFETRLDHQFRFRFPPSFRTKFAVAQLLLKEPKVLLMDEPESGLSDDDEARLMAAIKARAGRMTCIMVTHRPSLVRQADKALVLKDGQVAFFGLPSELDQRRA